MKRWCLLIAGMFAGVGAVCAADLVKTAQGSLEIQTFSDAMNQAGLTDVLKTKGPYTIFAPSNSAFSRLSSAEKNMLLSDGKKAEQLVSAHVVSGRMLITQIKPGKTQTIGGGTISLTSDNGLVKIQNASVIQSDLLADNGVIHIIDTVVLPEK